MEEKENTSVPYFVHEGMLARMERTIKRLWILCVVLIILFVGTNAGWIYYESQWETIETTVSQSVETDDGDGNLIVNGTGEVNYYGESKTNSIDTEP